MNIYYHVPNITNVCNPNEIESNKRAHSFHAYLVPRPRRNPQTIIQTLGLSTVQEYERLFFHSGVTP